MGKVSDEQVDFILREVQARGVTIEDLQWNLVDHMCCIIENEMSEDEDFYLFFEQLLPRFFSDNLREIEEETELLLTFKHFYAMKKTLIYSGLTASFFTVIGSLFKVMHWPGASISFVLGIGIFSLIFLPLMITLKLRDEVGKTDKLIMSFGLLTGMAASFGFLFKIMHWPFANVLMFCGLVGFTFIYVPLFFATRVRRPELRFNTIVHSVLMISAGGLLFAMMNLNKTKVDEASKLHYKALVEEIEKLETSVSVNLDSSLRASWINKMNEYHEEIQDLKESILQRSSKLSKSIFQTIPEWEAYGKMGNDQLVKQVMTDDMMTDWVGIKLNLRLLNELIASNYPNYKNLQFKVDEMELLNASTKVGVEQLTLIQMHLQVVKNALK